MPSPAGVHGFGCHCPGTDHDDPGADDHHGTDHADRCADDHDDGGADDHHGGADHDDCGADDHHDDNGAALRREQRCVYTGRFSLLRSRPNLSAGWN